MWLHSHIFPLKTLDLFPIGNGLVVGIKLKLDQKMRCIFCQEYSTNSKSVEHIIPESLGNKSHILGERNSYAMVGKQLFRT